MNRITRERINADIEESAHIRDLNRKFLLQPRVCDDCCLKTTRIVCPRCGGQCDIDETSDYYCPNDLGTVMNPNAVKQEGLLIDDTADTPDNLECDKIDREQYEREEHK